MRPMAVVVARSVVTIEVAVNLAGCIALANDGTKIRLFAVITGAKTLGIQRIDEAVVVVIDAITASVDFVLAARHFANRDRRVEAGSARCPRPCIGARSTQIATKLDSATAAKYDEQAEPFHFAMQG